MYIAGGISLYLCDKCNYCICFVFYILDFLINRGVNFDYLNTFWVFAVFVNGFLWYQRLI